MENEKQSGKEQIEPLKAHGNRHRERLTLPDSCQLSESEIQLRKKRSRAMSIRRYRSLRRTIIKPASD
ncbi:MAG TPA: hypothetical protein EYG51_19585 [Pseudomonadales bacterium]|nr:hypothetical protein [Pseudomonadales bacterium]